MSILYNVGEPKLPGYHRVSYQGELTAVRPLLKRKISLSNRERKTGGTVMIWTTSWTALCYHVTKDLIVDGLGHDEVKFDSSDRPLADLVVTPRTHTHSGRSTTLNRK